MTKALLVALKDQHNDLYTVCKEAEALQRRVVDDNGPGYILVGISLVFICWSNQDNKILFCRWLGCRSQLA